MIGKKIVIYLICIMFLVGIGSVCAENVDEASDLSAIDDSEISLDNSLENTEISLDDSIDDNIGSSIGSGGSDVHSAVTVNSWTALDSALNGTSGHDTVNIGSSMAPEKQIVINHDVTIVGSANTYIGGSDSSNMASYNYIPFMVTNNGLTITLKNIHFQNSGNNIFIQFSGNGNYLIENCTFTNMYASGDHQSVVYLNNGHGNITGCTFENCTTSFGTVTNHRAGSVNVYMIVRKSTFINNYATTEPGAINNCAHLIVYDSTFEDNHATWWAGAIHTHINANTTVVNSTFRNNLAGWNGGALYTYSYLRVINSTFVGNNATTNTGGGAIGASTYGSRPTVIVENSKFENNTALTGNGGAIVISSGTLTVSDSEFINNAAHKLSGGAISSSACTATVSNCEFKYNWANETSGKGGAISAGGKGSLTVDNCEFVNNSASINYGLALAYYYTGNSYTEAYLTYINNRFYGPNNGAGSVYVYNEKVNVTHYNNTIEDISNYTEPGNDTNGSGSVVPIPTGTLIGNQSWNVSLSGALGGTPLVVGDRIYVPNGHSIYCLNITTGNLLWNVSSNYVIYPEWDNFHDLGLHNGVLIAPCDGDKLYFFNATNGNQIQPYSTIIQGSSLYAPLVVGDTIYISSEYGYGVNNESWITVIKYNNGVYSYDGSILNIPGVSYGTHALISAPILWNNYLWVNTINGLMRVDLATGVGSVVLNNTVGKIVVGGSYLYILTSDNHIRGVNANGNVVKNIAVGGNVGSTLAINSDNTVLYTVNANGDIYAAKTTDSSATLIKNINPVSSALTVGDDGILYVGDDAGIIWAFNITPKLFGWNHNIVWAYNLTSMTYGSLLFDNNVIYVGTNDTFYAFNCSITAINSLRNVMQLNNQKAFLNELLGVNSFEGILAEDVTDTTWSFNTFSHSNTIYELVYDNYNASADEWYIGYGSNGVVNNIIIRPKDGKKVTVTILKDIQFVMGNNITLENIIFTGQTGPNTSFHAIFGLTYGCTVTFKNCTFENVVNTQNSVYDHIFNVGWNADPATSVNFEGCKFINCVSYGNIILVSSVEQSVNIKDCTFDNVSSKLDNVFYFGGNTNWENNTILNSNVNTSIAVGGSNNLLDASFEVLPGTLIVGKEGSIVAKLVDVNGNLIKAEGLQFKINENYVDPTSFDSTTGLYTYKFTPSDVGAVSVSARCSSVDDLDATDVDVLVKSVTDLSVNCSDSGVYGTEFKVNATLNSTITGENITFTVLDSTNNPVKSANTTITSGFASYSFTDLPAGEYTVVANYAGGTSFAPANGNKTFTITQADSSVTINVLNKVIYVGEAIQVNATVPVGATGDVTFTILNDVTVNVSDVATFDALPNGTYTIYAVYNGDANYKASEKVNITITVVKYDLNLNIAADNITYGEALVVKVTTNANFTGELLVKIGDLNQTANITKGTGNATFANLTAAQYLITAVFAENNMFNADSKNTTAVVKGVEVPADKAISTSVPDNSKSPTFSIKLDKDATGNFTVSVDNGKIVKTVALKDGSASITVDDLATGDHKITISYSGDGKYAPITQNTTVNIKEPAKPKVNKKTTKIVAKKKTFKAKKKVKKYTITLKAGKTPVKKVWVTLKIKGKKAIKAKTNNKGKATFKIKNLKKKGKYTATIKFKGNNNYKQTSKKVKITVKK